jgi:hypothetical protein
MATAFVEFEAQYNSDYPKSSLTFYFGISEMNDPMPDALAPMGAQSSP